MFGKLIQKIAAYPSSLFFIVYLLTFLIYLPDNGTLTRSLRLMVLVALFFSALSVDTLRKELYGNIRSLSGLAKGALLVFVGAIIWSSLRPLVSNNRLWFGSPPEYLGVVTWLLFLGFGLLFRKSIKRYLMSQAAVAVFATSILISLLANNFYLRHGYRMAGVMFQPTTMGMYGIVVVLVCIYLLVRRKQPRWLLLSTLLMALLTVILSQSRIAYVTLAALLSVCALYYFRKRRRLSLGLVVIVVGVAIIPQLSRSYFSRFRSDSVQRGFSYRLDIYKVAGKDVVNHNVLVGNGPDSLPTAINNTNAVPEEIAKSLRLGGRFLSAHDLFFDIAYFFGCLASFAVLFLSGLAIRSAMTRLSDQDLFLLLIFVSLCINALFNVPSLELTSLYFVVLFGLLDHEKTS